MEPHIGFKEVLEEKRTGESTRAFEVWWALRVPPLRRLGLRLLRDVYDTEDAVQETGLRVWRGLDTFEIRSDDVVILHRLSCAWSSQIMYSICQDILRRAGRRRFGVEPEVPTEPPEGPPSEGASCCMPTWASGAPAAPFDARIEERIDARRELEAMHRHTATEVLQAAAGLRPGPVPNWVKKAVFRLRSKVRPRP